MTFPTSGRFVGRDEELADLRDALDDARGGTARLLLLAGEAGIGKTRLLVELADLARADGTMVLTGSPAPYAYGPLVGILRGLRREVGDAKLRKLLTGVRRPLARLVPGLEPDAGHGADAGDGQVTSQGPLFEAVLDLIAELGSDRDLLVGAEDLHDADDSTRELVSFLADNLTTERILLVATCRTGGNYRERIGGWLSELVRHPRVSRTDLSPLSDRQVTELLASLDDDRPDEEVAMRISRRSRGNPFYVEQLRSAGVGDGGVPAGLQEVLAARLAQLSDDARQVLSAAAVLGDRPHDELLRDVVEPADDELRDGLREVADQRLLVPEGERSDRYRFRHDLIREVTHQRLLVDERHRLHTRAARRLEDDPDLAEGGSDRVNAELARHWHLAGEPDEALSASLAAADEAERVHGLSEVLAHLRRALELWDDTSQDTRREAGPRHELEERCAHLAWLLGDVSAAQEHIERALQQPDLPADRRGLLHLRAGRYLRGQGRFDLADERTTRGLEELPDEPSVERAEALALVAQNHLLSGRARQALRYSDEALETALELEDRTRESAARDWRGCALQALGREEEAIEELCEVVSIAEELDDPEEIKGGYNNLSEILRRSGRTDRAVETLREGYAQVSAHGITGSKLEGVALTVIEALTDAGRWDEAQRWCSSIRSVARSAVFTDVQEAHAIGRLRLGQGRLQEARDLLDRAAEQLTDPADPQMEGPYLAARTELAILEGRYDEVCAAVDRARERGERIRDDQDLTTYHACVYLDPTLTHGIRAEADRASAARKQGDVGAVTDASNRASRLLETLRETTDAAPEGSHLRTRMRAAASQGEAELTRLEGDPNPDAWHEAVDATAATGMPHREAYTRFRLAEALLEHDRRDDAAEALERADEIATEVGAEPLRQQIASLARRGRLGLEIAQRADELGNDLTPRQTDVLELLTDGHTNQEIAEQLYITEKTVERHVTNILRKLQVDNRTQAAAVARERDLLATG